MMILRFVPGRIRLRRAAAAFGALAILVSGTACAAALSTMAAPATPISVATAPPSTPPKTPLPSPTGAVLPPQPTQTQRRGTAQPSAVEEQRMLEVEWPAEMRLGESDTLRLSLLPVQEGYAVSAEFEEHQIQNGAVTVARMEGYSLWAAARVDAAGFLLSPEGEQPRELSADSPVTWRWTLTPRGAGRQRISVALLLRWVPLEAAGGSVREREVYSRSLTINVTSFLGLTAPQAAAAGFLGLGFGGAFSLPLVWFLLRPRARRMRAAAPNPALRIELPPRLTLAPAEQNLLRALFRLYARITVEAEFRSGYSGARTFLVLPVRADGRSDAYTIAKLGDPESVRREYENYETFVKDTLPPITARIQETPVTAASAGSGRSGPAALRYTFIGEPGKKPVSLREALQADPDPALLERLFATFGPGWWMQRRPYVFRAAQEYDRALPAHFVVEPAAGRTQGELDGRAAPGECTFPAGQTVRLRNFRVAETRPGGESVSLRGEPPPGQPALRVRWLRAGYGDGSAGRIVDTRATLLRGLTAGLDLGGLPNPLDGLAGRLAERIRGTQSVLHGDLNLENILTGPGGTVWLIDFAQTREGHALADFAHLQAEIVAHLVAPALPSPGDFPAVCRGDRAAPPAFALLGALEKIAARCLFNPADEREYRLALFFSALGALKYSNLDRRQRNVLYLYAALIQSTL